MMHMHLTEINGGLVRMWANTLLLLHEYVRLCILLNLNASIYNFVLLMYRKGVKYVTFLSILLF